MKLFHLLLLALLLLTTLAIASPDEAVGRVTKVVDGDTIDVQLQSHDSRISEDTIRVRLAALDASEMKTPQGPPAKAYTANWLQSVVVSLDLDGRNGKDPYGRWVAVVYLQKPDGTLQNCNRMLVEAGQACVWDFSNNEFNPADWWGGQISAGVCIKVESTGPVARPRSRLRANGPFVGSSKSNKYHYPSCSAAKKIAPANLVTFACSAEARAGGV
jgi:micrococcal nuclease